MSGGKPFDKGHTIGAATRWKPGVSPNPGGRLKSQAVIARVILDKTKNGEEIIDGLLAIFRDAATDPRVKVMAGKELLDRCAGRPTQTLDVGVGEEQPVDEPSVEAYIDGLNDKERAALEVLLAGNTPVH